MANHTSQDGHLHQDISAKYQDIIDTHESLFNDPIESRYHQPLHHLNPIDPVPPRITSENIRQLITQTQKFITTKTNVVNKSIYYMGSNQSEYIRKLEKCANDLDQLSNQLQNQIASKKIKQPLHQKMLAELENSRKEAHIGRVSHLCPSANPIHRLCDELKSLILSHPVLFKNSDSPFYSKNPYDSPVYKIKPGNVEGSVKTCKDYVEATISAALSQRQRILNNKQMIRNPELQKKELNRCDAQVAELQEILSKLDEFPLKMVRAREKAITLNSSRLSHQKHLSQIKDKSQELLQKRQQLEKADVVYACSKDNASVNLNNIYTTALERFSSLDRQITNGLFSKEFSFGNTKYSSKLKVIRFKVKEIKDLITKHGGSIEKIDIYSLKLKLDRLEGFVKKWEPKFISFKRKQFKSGLLRDISDLKSLANQFIVSECARSIGHKNYFYYNLLNTIEGTRYVKSRYGSDTDKNASTHQRSHQTVSDNKHNVDLYNYFISDVFERFFSPSQSSPDYLKEKDICLKQMTFLASLSNDDFNHLCQKLEQMSYVDNKQVDKNPAKYGLSNSEYSLLQYLAGGRPSPLSYTRLPSLPYSYVLDQLKSIKTGLNKTIANRDFDANSFRIYLDNKRNYMDGTAFEIEKMPAKLKGLYDGRIQWTSADQRNLLHQKQIDGISKSTMDQKHFVQSELKGRHALSHLLNPLDENRKQWFQIAYQELKTEWQESGQSRTFPFIPVMAEHIHNWIENGQKSLNITKSYNQNYDLHARRMLGNKHEPGVCFGLCMSDAMDHLTGVHKNDHNQHMVSHPDLLDSNFFTSRDIQHTSIEYDTRHLTAKIELLEGVHSSVSFAKQTLSKFSKNLTTVKILDFSKIDGICNSLKPGGVASIYGNWATFDSKGQNKSVYSHQINCKRNTEGKFILFEPNVGDIYLGDTPEEASNALKMAMMATMPIRFSNQQQPFASFIQIDGVIAEPRLKQ